MTVLVATASKHGATQEIAEAIGVQLRARGLEVQLHVLSDDGAADAEPLDYEAVVLGSAVYLGRWQASARRFVSADSAALRQRPVWLFSSGPVGKSPKRTDSVSVDSFVADSGARGHRLFSGKLDRRSLGRRERAMVALVGAADGDNRDWDAIRGWADDIAVSLRPQGLTEQQARTA